MSAGTGAAKALWPVMVTILLLTMILLLPTAAWADKADPSLSPAQTGLPGDVKLTSVERSGGTLRVKWEEVSFADGYRVEYARNALWRPTKVRTVSREETGVTLKVKNPKTWCVRVKAFSKRKGQMLWSPRWTGSLMSESVEAKVSFLKRGGSRLDIRKEAGARLKNHDIGEGACSDGKNIYVCMEYRTRDKLGNKTVEIRIAKVRLSDRKLLKVSGNLAAGHANSLVYNKRLNRLIATGYKTRDPYLRLIHPKTLKVVKRVKVDTSLFGDQPEGFNALGYDYQNDSYFIRARDYFGYVYVLNNRFKAVERMVLAHNPDTDIQGFEMEEDSFFLSQSRYQTSDKNTITIFGRDGQKLQDIRLHLTGELESVFRVGDRYYGTVHVKTKVSTADRKRIKQIQKANRGKPKTERKSVQPIYTKYRKTYIFQLKLP